MPPRPRRVVLIGLRGSGKSTVGRALAVRWGLPFVDSDAWIAERCARSAGEIIRAEGERAFRRHEQRAVRALARLDEGVLALGGGALCCAANRRALAAWRPVLLEASIETLCLRIAADDADRPPLSALPRAAELRAQRDARRPSYLSMRPIIVDTEGRSAEEVVRLVARALTAERTSLSDGDPPGRAAPEEGSPRAGGRE